MATKSDQSYISVIIPIYNSECYLFETLDSLISQTCDTWECILIDDGSTDGSAEIAQAYCIKDSRFKYFYQDNLGPSAARNKGLKIAKGDYIQFLDSDDVLIDNRFEILLKKYAHIESNVILYSKMIIGKAADIRINIPPSRDSDFGRDIGFNEMYRNFLIDFIFIPSCPLFPREFLKNLSWDTSLNHSEDWDYYLKIIKKGKVFRSVDLPLVIYRDTPDSLSKDVSRTIKANYSILFNWMDSGNRAFFIKRSAFLLHKSIIHFLTRKTRSISGPLFLFRKANLIQSVLLFLVFPVSFYYTVKRIFK